MNNKIAITGIVVNVIMNMIGWFVAWRLSKKTSHATLLADKPIAKPKRKRRLTETERWFLRLYRFMQVGLGLIIISEPFSHYTFYGFPPDSIGDWIAAILTVGVMAGFTTTIFLFEKNEIRQIKNGQYIKRLKQIAREREKAATQFRAPPV